MHVHLFWHGQQRVGLSKRWSCCLFRPQEKIKKKLEVPIHYCRANFSELESAVTCALGQGKTSQPIKFELFFLYWFGGIRT